VVKGGQVCGLAYAAAEGCKGEISDIEESNNAELSDEGSVD